MSEFFALETVDLVEPWLYGTMAGDASLMALIGGEDHLSGTLSPDELPLPYVTMILQSTRDIQTHGGIIIANESLYEVKAVAATSTWDDVIPIGSRLYELLHRPYEIIDLPGGGSLTCIRERGIQYAENTEGVQYRHLGASWRIRASRDN